MEKHKSLPINTLLDNWLRNEGLETPLLQYRLIKGWPEVMGTTVAQYTKDIKIYNNVLRVKISSPALRQNLLMMRTEIARKMNNFVKAQIIQEVTFY
jgi:predicted nucleic acid-binding Zn ribbon protein